MTKKKSSNLLSKTYNLNNEYKCQKIGKKNGKNYQKYAKILDVKILQDIPFNLEIIQ